MKKRIETVKKLIANKQYNLALRECDIALRFYPTNLELTILIELRRDIIGLVWHYEGE